MDDNNIKMITAKLALPYIESNMVVGLGGGATIGYVVDYLAHKGLFDIKVVTPSETIKAACRRVGLEVLDLSYVTEVDMAFDSCDYVDEDFYALKSGGGIHTEEKLIARMAKQYVLLVDESKLEKKLTFLTPIVLECIKTARSYIQKEVAKLGGHVEPRKSYAKDGFTISDNGNLLMDAEFDNIEDIAALNRQLKDICGLIETSLFTEEVTRVLIASEEGYKVMNKYR